MQSILPVGVKEGRLVDVVVVEGRWGGRVVVVGGRRGATLILPMGAPALLRGLPSPPLALLPLQAYMHYVSHVGAGRNN